MEPLIPGLPGGDCTSVKETAGSQHKGASRRRGWGFGGRVTLLLKMITF